MLLPLCQMRMEKKMNDVQVKVLFSPKGSCTKLPEYQSLQSSGADVYADILEDFVIKPGKTELIPTGLYVEIPEGFEIQIRPRSGLAIKKSVGILNSPGTIDSDYRGEVKIVVHNFSEDEFVVSPGDRIAQMVLSPVYKIRWQEIAKLSETKRSGGGFGHTGVKG